VRDLVMDRWGQRKRRAGNRDSRQYKRDR